MLSDKSLTILQKLTECTGMSVCGGKHGIFMKDGKIFDTKEEMEKYEMEIERCKTPNPL